MCVCVCVCACAPGVHGAVGSEVGDSDAGAVAEADGVGQRERLALRRRHQLGVPAAQRHARRVHTISGLRHEHKCAGNAQELIIRTFYACTRLDS